MTHYQRRRRTGRLDKPSLYERLMQRVEWDGDCLVDPKCPPGKYPRVGKRTASHVVLEHHGIQRPDGYEGLHSCDRPECVNIAHLRWGTHAENMAEMADRCRAAAPRKRLNNDDIESIRSDGRRRRIIAAEYGIHVNTVGQIKNRTHGY